MMRVEPVRRCTRTRLSLACMLLALTLASSAAWAGGPRLTAGVGWGTWAGNAVGWNTTTLLYFTDPGSLSPTVTHSQADAMVAAAASVWNVPTSSLSLTQGGTLAEDVSSSNVIYDGQEFVFPSDVQSSNESQIPIAIIYDQDGSLIDLLLGEGASEPDGCLQNGVVGDIDDVHPDDAALHHATLILNGRCVGSSQEQLTQMQYQLARSFGRVLGLSWSQTNDNVFTAQSTISANQVAYWPLLHPLDVICGNYTYQCMTNPFTLRPDDLNTLAQLYPVYQAAVPAGKLGTSDDALYLRGFVFFPSGQGMDWVNITTRRDNGGVTENWQTTSGITGYAYQQQIATPLNDGPSVSQGADNPAYEGFSVFRRIPLNGVSNVYFTTEPINPLYIGDAAVGPYVRPPATPSGPNIQTVDWSALSAGDLAVTSFVSADQAANAACTGQDGSEAAPATVDASGWQAGLLCNWGHNSWWTVPVQAGHSWTLEVTATDESGAATVNKAQPVVGVWNSGDATGGPPTVNSQPVPFNSMSLGMTRLQMSSPDQDQSYRISVSDQFGAGRPDFTYVARVLYASAVTPSVVGTGGGRITISGTGFREGNQVLVNNAPARILSLTATQIVADAPSFSEAAATIGVPVTISVLDADTQGSATISAALSYAAEPDLVQQISAPQALEVDVTSPMPLAIRVTASDGISPVSHTAVTLSVTAGQAQFSLCQGAGNCTVNTDANGTISTFVTATVTGPVTLLATEVSGGGFVQMNYQVTAPVRAAAFNQPDRYVAAGASGTWTLDLTAFQDGVAAVGAPVSWSSSAGVALSMATTTTAQDGLAGLTVEASGMDSGSTETVTGCVWSSVCATWSTHGVPPSEWLVTAAANTSQQVAFGTHLQPVTLLVTDEAGHVLQGAQVKVYQRVLGWEGSCEEGNRCPAAPVLTTSQASVTSDQAGQITISPLEVPGVPEIVEIAASAGAYGFATLTLVKTP